MVFDASALLAYLRDEPGSDVVARRFGADAGISAVNMSEVLARLHRDGAPQAEVRRLETDSPLVVFPFGLETASVAAELIRSTQALGLSLGDRCCLATAIMRDEEVLTGDRAWERLPQDLSRRVVLIR